MVIAAIGVIVMYLLLPENVFDENCCAHTGFARRWDGTCGGWTRDLAMLHITGDLFHWHSYVTASMVILQHHPIMSRVKYSGAAVYTMVAFIFGCGLTHLFEAYATFHPVYYFTGWFKLFNGVVSEFGQYFIAYSLVIAFERVAEYRKKLDSI